MRECQYFSYGDTEVEYLKARDPKLAEVIDQVGHVNRQVIPDLFQALVNSIVGQQISTKAQETIWRRIEERFDPITPGRMAAVPAEELQSCGISLRKAGYIRGIADRMMDGTLDLELLQTLPDDQVCKALDALPGIGVWTAEMLMIFSMQRPDILSFGDLGIQRGLRMVYHHRNITPELFQKYRRRYSPYGTTASLYLWAVAGGAVEGMRDYAPGKKKEKKPCQSRGNRQENE